MSRTIGWLSLSALLVAAMSLSSWRAALAADAPPEPTVNVTDAGEGEKHVMRFQPKVDDVQHFRFTQRMAIAQSINGMPMQKTPSPPVSYDLKLTVKDVDTANDAITCAFECTDIAVTDAPGTPPGVAAQIQTMLEPMKEWRAEALYTSRGIMKSYTQHVPDNLPDMSKQMMDSMAEATHQLVSPLPEEAIGNGATWVTTIHPTLSGIAFKQEMRYHVNAITRESLSFDVELTQEAEKQTIETMGVTLAIEAYSAKGTGSGTLEMALLMAKRATTSLEQHMEMRAVQDGTAISQDMDMTMTVEHVEPSADRSSAGE